MIAAKVDGKWRIAEETINLKEGDVLRVCSYCGIILGLKQDQRNTCVSHGACDECLQKALIEARKGEV